MTALLEVKNLTRAFVGLVAVNDVSFSLQAGRITALIGPNGAGKTTCFNLVAGALRPTAGQVLFEGRSLEREPPEAVCRMGIARTFQIVRPMKDMSVLENAMVGAFSWTTNVKEAREKAYESLENVGLAGKANARTDQLTLPDRKMLEMAKALSTRPKLLLLDEVMAGLRPTEAAGVVGVLHRLAKGGLTILLVEHVMRIVMEVASTVVVLHHGAKIAEGKPSEVVANPAVLESYLGAGFHA
ncbi:ABC transporter [Bradyrhizobium sp. UNPF46]|uniref:ABC transporter ATP-binding protein n=1 Tax=Bradyrhizobium sp. UNPF46 TaxID=1141168 RepID=UPI00114E4ECC|nr:ABC transporter ATP-binding protein [Bradyrhizobium sp. UNPF46]TQF39603.1 ABC transporter [Bradyrhizobium sp. UNPF46]